jgi:hypothetical protein
MLLEENAAQLAQEMERARDDSITLWRILNAANPNSDDAERQPLELAGRYRVGDGNEFAGEIIEITQQGLRIKGPKTGVFGARCTVNVASVGMVEGLVVEARAQSFVIGVIAPRRRLTRLAQRMNWLLRRRMLEVEERRSSQRIDMNRAKAEISTSGGQIYSCEIFDLSEGGAALHLGENALYFWLDQPVLFQGRAGRVLRSFPGGIVIKFE